MIIEEEKAITETEKSVPTASTVDRDGQWKEISCEFFDDLLAAALPELLEAMDTDKRPEFQEQELRAVATTTGGKERNIDLLAKVALKSGKNVHVLLHIEIQDSDDDDFPERMFRYRSLLMARYLKSYEDKGRAVLVNDKAEDIVSVDLAGKSAIADFMVIATGRNTRQLAAMAHHVAEKLAELTPGDHAKKSALFNSGAEAVENAIKIARVATGRTAVVCFDHAYHGRTNLTMALTAKSMPYKHKKA